MAFSITITSIDELIAFVAIIRSPDADLQKLQELTNNLRKSTDTLVAAEQGDRTNG